MPNYQDETIATALDSIARRHYVLPAIQREFVWGTDQICKLFDSVMRGYPIASLLYWHIEREHADDFRWYDFVLNYHELERPGCVKHENLPIEDRVAVLDGQQRLTAFNIGLRGSHAARAKYKWVGRPQSYPTKFLFLDLCSEPRLSDDRYEDLIYRFEFMEEDRAAEENSDGDRDVHWFRVSELMSFPADDAFQHIQDYAHGHGLADSRHAAGAIHRLWKAVYVDRHLSFFTERAQDLDRVLDIFIRANSQGEPLTKSDLLMSIATAQWKERDARKAIPETVAEVNGVGAGFRFERDNILKAGLVLAGISDVGFVARTFDRANMEILEQQWDDISASLYRAAELMSSFGLSGDSIGQKSILIPIAYYLQKSRLGDGYLESPSYAADRQRVRDWTIRALLMPGVFGSGLDTLLRRLRQAIDEHGGGGFPSDEIEAAMAGLGKSLRFDEGLVDELIDTRYGQTEVIGLLSILYGHVNPSRPFHVDHIFPRTLFRRDRLTGAGLSAEQVELAIGMRDRLPNLQLLPGGENIGKSAKLPRKWASEQYPDRTAFDGYLTQNDMRDLPTDFAGFLEFYDARRNRLRNRLLSVLGREPGSLDGAEP